MSLQLLIEGQQQSLDSLSWALYGGWETCSSSGRFPSIPNIVRAVYMETPFIVISKEQSHQLVAEGSVWLVDSWSRELFIMDEDLFSRAYIEIHNSRHSSHFQGPPQELRIGPSYVLCASPLT